MTGIVSNLVIVGAMVATMFIVNLPYLVH